MRKILSFILSRNVSTIYDAKTGGTRKVSCVKDSDFNIVIQQFLYQIKLENGKKIISLNQRRDELVENKDELEIGNNRKEFINGRIHEIDFQIEELKRTNYEL